MPAQAGPYRRPGKNGWYAHLAVPDGTKRSGYRYCVRSLRTEDAAEARRRFPGVYASLQEEFGLIQPGSRQRLREAAEDWFESVAEGADSLLDAIEQVSRYAAEVDGPTQHHRSQVIP